MNVKMADRIRAIATAIASGILLYALYVSREHIAHVGHTIGLRTWEAETLFILVDIPIILGKLMSLNYFAPSTKRAGRKMMVSGITISLGCNVASGWIGGGIGAAVYGVFVVMMALAMEWAIGKIKPAGAVTRAKTAVKTPAPKRATRTNRRTSTKPTTVTPAVTAPLAPLAAATTMTTAALTNSHR